MHKNIYLNSPLYINKEFNLQWNWGVVLLFVLVWSYGYENIVYPESGIKTLLVLAMIIMAVIVINQTSGREGEIFHDSAKFSRIDIFVFAIYVIVFSVMSIIFAYKLNISLVGDQLYHAQNSQNLSMGISNYIIDTLHLPLIMEYKSIIRFINFIILALMIYGVFLIQQYRLEDKTVLIIALLLLFKSGHIYTDVHPPFRLFPLWISSIFFGINDFTFRIVSLIGLSFVAFIIYKFSLKKLGVRNAFLLGFTLGTIPLMLHVGSIVEQSIWSIICWTFVLFSIAETKNRLNYVRMFSIVSIASLMRAPTFVALFPLFLLLFLEYMANSASICKIKKCLHDLIPILVLIPFLWIQLTHGTSATSDDGSILSKLTNSLSSGFSFKMMYYNIGIPWILFFLLAFWPVNSGGSKVLAIIVFFALAYTIFYSIRPYLWGLPRYQAELWLPFIFLGFHKLVVYINSHDRFSKFIIPILATLIVFNIYSLNVLYKRNPSIDSLGDYYEEVKSGKVKIWSEGVFNTRDALNAVSMSGYAYSECKVGITYGNFSEIMAGYTIAEIRSTKENDSVCNGRDSLNIDEINNNKNINLILFIDKGNKQKDIQALLESKKWVLWKTFANEQYGSTIVGLIRK